MVPCRMDMRLLPRVHFLDGHRRNPKPSGNYFYSDLTPNSETIFLGIYGRKGFELTFVELEPTRTSKSLTRVEPNFRGRTQTESSRVKLSNSPFKWCKKYQYSGFFCKKFCAENLCSKKLFWNF